MSLLRSRLRKTFAYPSSDEDASDNEANDYDDDTSDRELDEEHQEKLIARLAAEDARRSAVYGRVFVAVPLVAALYFGSTLLWSLSRAATTGGAGRGTAAARDRGVAVVAVSSLLCTAYVLHFMPVDEKNTMRKSGGEGEGWRGKGRLGSRLGDARGPLEKFLVPLNAVLVVVMQLAAVLSWRRGAIEEAWRESLPAIVFGICMFARQQLAPVDLEGLKKARYDLKGA